MPELQGNHESDPSEFPIKRICVCELFFLDRVLYARKTGNIEEISATNARGDNISVDDAMVLNSE